MSFLNVLSLKRKGTENNESKTKDNGRQKHAQPDAEPARDALGTVPYSHQYHSARHGSAGDGNAPQRQSHNPRCQASHLQF
jgi:hypothetical protein